MAGPPEGPPVASRGLEPGLERWEELGGRKEGRGRKGKRRGEARKGSGVGWRTQDGPEVDVQVWKGFGVGIQRCWRAAGGDWP